eukprot:scaffold86304_cov58-Phaeocystis_antarctica.AAC.9
MTLSLFGTFAVKPSMLAWSLDPFAFVHPSMMQEGHGHEWTACTECDPADTLDSPCEDLVIDEDRVQARRLLIRQGCEKRRSKQQMLHAKACLQLLGKVPGLEPLWVFLPWSATPPGEPAHEVTNLRPCSAVSLRLA